MSPTDTDTIADKAMQTLMHMYVEESPLLPSSQNLLETVAGWYKLDPQQAKEVITEMNTYYPEEMRDMGYCIRRKGEWFPQDFDPVLRSFEPLLSVIPNRGYAFGIQHYIGTSIEGGTWTIWSWKPQLKEELEGMLKEDILTQVPDGLRISDTVLERIAAAYHITP